MAKLKLVANPTFTAKVGIPIAGGEPVEVVFTFKHRTKAGMEEWFKSRAGQTDVESFMDFVVGWNLDEPYSKETCELLLENYMGSAIAAFQVYVDELFKSRLKNS